jgi:glycosyltransferase involved in cell wall biosynthesis
LQRHAPDEAEKLCLTIVGKGPLRGELEHMAADLGVMNVTTFTGWVPYAEVPAYLNQLDIFVAPSRMESESFGVAILEASSCGIPVVVSDVGGLPEVVKHGETGVVVESENVGAFAEAMHRLICDRTLRKRMGDAGRNRVVSQYQWEANVSLMEDVYLRVLRKHDEMSDKRLS